MASKNKLAEAAGASVQQFFSGAADREQTTAPESDTDRFLNLLKSGKSREDALAELGKKAAWGSQVLSKLRKSDPERLIGTGEEQPRKHIPPKRTPKAADSKKGTKDPVQATQIGLETILDEKANISPQAEKKAVETAQTKPQRTLIGFRADLTMANSWKAYATAKGMEIGELCSKGVMEYIERNPIPEDAQALYDAKMTMLELESKS